jgi:EAL domain-containing protein (putative c-di-GMP-specific phosphodiesterase class I)
MGMEGAWGPASDRGGGSLERILRGGPKPPSRVPVWVVVLVIAVLLGASTVAMLFAGRSFGLAPHLFYIPILVAAVRFGPVGALVTALAAAVLSGPVASMLPDGTSEPLPEWAARGVFYLALAMAMALVAASRREHEEAADRSRQTISRLNERLRFQEKELARRREATERVQRMLKEDTLRVVVQPIADLLSGQVVGVEALSRFNASPERAPDLWFAEANEVGLGLELELKAVRGALDLVDSLPPNVYLAVNLSPDTIASPRFVELMDGVPPERVVLEVTEHAPIEDYGILAKSLESFRARGCRLAVDDAGAGFASFRHILRLNPDIIKLDMTLTRNIDQDPARRALASGLISFASDLGAKIIAEGLETTSELGALRTLGVRLGQGYYLARPGPLSFVDFRRVEKILRPMSLAGGGAAPLPGQGGGVRTAEGTRPRVTIPEHRPSKDEGPGPRVTIPEHRPEQEEGDRPGVRPSLRPEAADDATRARQRGQELQ